MPRTYNPFATSLYPVDPTWGMIGSNLVTALFGDPDARMQQEVQQAELARARAAVGYDEARTRGQNLTNFGGASMAGMIANPGMFYRPREQTTAPPVMPGLPGVTVSGVPVAPAGGADGGYTGPLTSEGVSGLVRTMFPNARITSGARDPNSALGRKNPRSYHNSGRAIDMAPVPGMTFEQMRDRLAAEGVPIVEAIDEVKNPSKHATGPHWHFAFGDKPAAAARSTPIPGGGSAPAATVSAPVMAPEDLGMEVDRGAMASLLLSAALGDREAAITPLAQALLAMGGGDENMRQALVAGGKEPGANFAASRGAQLNNMALDQYGDLAQTIGEQNLIEAGSTQRENIQQAGETARNNADNAVSIRGQDIQAATTRRGQDMQDRRSGAGGKSLSAADTNSIYAEIGAQLPFTQKNPNASALNTALARRASDLLAAGQVRSVTEAVQRATQELGVSYDPGSEGEDNWGWWNDKEAKGASFNWNPKAAQQQPVVIPSDVENILNKYGVR
jgi:hypothetical protein